MEEITEFKILQCTPEGNVPSKAIPSVTLTFNQPIVKSGADLVRIITFSHGALELETHDHS